MKKKGTPRANRHSIIYTICRGKVRAQCRRPACRGWQSDNLPLANGGMLGVRVAALVHRAVVSRIDG